MKKSKTAVQPTSDSTPSVALKSDVVFKTIAERMKENVAIAKSINGIFLYNITKDGQIAKKWSKFYLCGDNHVDDSKMKIFFQPLT